MFPSLGWGRSLKLDAARLQIHRISGREGCVGRREKQGGIKIEDAAFQTRKKSEWGLYGQRTRSSLPDILLEELESVIVRLQDGIPCFP